MPDGSEKYIEEIPGVGPQYNVGNIVKDLLDHYIRIQPNRATPAQIGPLISEFKAMTNELMAKSFTTPMAPLMGVPMPEQWRADLDAFRSRLEAYEAAVKAAAPNDRKAILNSVTIPMFFGSEGPGGKLLRGADIRTPFQLANGLMLKESWLSGWIGRIWDAIKDLIPTLPDIPPPLQWPNWLKLLASVTGVYLVVKTAKAVGRR